MKTRFIYVFLTFLIVGSQFTLSAQNPNQGNVDKRRHFTPEQLMQKQANQMIRTLMLDDATATKFAPVYENYLKELRDCRMINHKSKPVIQEIGKEGIKPKSNAILTDAEVEQQIEARFAQSRKILDIRERYYKEFRKMLSPKQIMKIYQTEKSNANKFKKEFDRRRIQMVKQGKDKKRERR